MYHVSFPGLGINLDINNQIELFGIHIYWYGIIIATGLICAVAYGCINSKRLGITADNLLNCVIAGVITGILGARLYYVFFNWDYYGANPEKILAINEGGLAIYGGIIGALIGGLIVGKVTKMNLPALLDVAAVGFLIGQGIGRWGNFFNQEAYGVATSLPWGMMSEGTNNIAVHPCFLYESIWCLLGALLLHLFSRSKFRKYHGQMVLIYMVWYGAERTFVEGLRTDSLYIPNTGIRVSQLLSILIMITGIAMLVYFYIRKYEHLVPVKEITIENCDKESTNIVDKAVAIADKKEAEEVTEKDSDTNESKTKAEEKSTDVIKESDVKEVTSSTEKVSNTPNNKQNKKTKKNNKTQKSNNNAQKTSNKNSSQKEEKKVDGNSNTKEVKNNSDNKAENIVPENSDNKQTESLNMAELQQDNSDDDYFDINDIINKTDNKNNSEDFSNEQKIDSILSDIKKYKK